MFTIYSWPALRPDADFNPQLLVRPKVYTDPPVAADFTGGNGTPHSQGDPAGKGFDNFRPNYRVLFQPSDPYFESIEELFDDKAGKPFSNSGHRTYVRRFRVLVKTNLIGPAGVCGCPGVPMPYAPYIPNRREEWDYLAVAVDIEAVSENKGDWQAWIVTVNYSTDVGPAGPSFLKTGLGNALAGTQQNPWDEPVVVESDIETETVYPAEDLDGKAYNNSADQPFTPPYSHPTGYRVYTVTRNEKKTDFENRVEDYVYVVNNAPYKGYPAGYVLCTGGRGPLLWRGSVPYYRVTYKFLCKKRTLLPGSPTNYTAGWQPKILNAGMFQKDALFNIVPLNATLVPIIKMGHQVNQPVLLDANGREQTEKFPMDYAIVSLRGKLKPIWLNFKAFRAVDLSALVTF